MGKRDLTDMLGGGGGRTRQKYRCKADGCQVTPMGVNLAKQLQIEKAHLPVELWESDVFGPKDPNA